MVKPWATAKQRWFITYHVFGEDAPFIRPKSMSKCITLPPGIMNAEKYFAEQVLYTMGKTLASRIIGYIKGEDITKAAELLKPFIK